MVKRFQFRLDKIRKLRSRTEREARRHLAWASGLLAEARISLARADRARLALQAEGGTLVLAGKAAALPLHGALSGTPAVIVVNLNDSVAV